MMPASKHGDPQLGVDIHLCTVPPSPSPVPLPTPHISVVFDPFDYIPILGATVSVCGMKRATAGTAGIAVHIPPGFPFAPMLPQKEDELFMGSATVVADGDPFSYIALPVLSCQIVGMPSVPRRRKKGPKKMMLCPLSFNLAIPTNVFVGGPPTISLMGMAMQGAFAGLGKLAKSKVAKNLAERMRRGKKRKKVGLCNSPGEPINSFTGEVYNDFEDYKDHDTSFVWERHYRSGWNLQDGPLGYGFRHFYQRALTFDDGHAVYETHDDEGVALARLDGGSYQPADGFKLSTNDGCSYELKTDRDETLEFELQAEPPSSARLVRYTTKDVDIYLFYAPNGSLRGFSEYRADAPIDTHLVYDTAGRIEQVLRGARGQRPLTVSRYVYEDGCLVEWHDPLGAIARFRYDSAHRMVQGTDRRGYSFHWHYDGKTGRCVKSYGDDGLWGVEAKYEGTTSTFTEPDGGEWTFKHYPDGSIWYVIDPLGGVKQYVKDDRGRIARQIMPGGKTYEWLYNAEGKHIGRLDPFGYRCPPEDAEPNPPNPLEHRGPETPMQWLFGRSLRRCHPGSDAFPTAVRAVLSSLRPASSIGSPMPKPAHDSVGRIVEQPYLGGSSEHFKHDAEGNVVARQDPNGNWHTQEITSWNKIGAQKSATGAVTRYGYSHRGEVTSIVDGNGNVTKYLRDKRQRISTIVVNGVVLVSYAHDQHDSVVEERDAYGRLLITYETTSLGLYSSAKLAEGEQYTYEYDAFGNITNASSSQHEIKQKYDACRRTHDLRDGLGVAHVFRSRQLVTTSYFGKFIVKYTSNAGGCQVQTPDGSKHTFWFTDRATIVRQSGNGTCEAMCFDDAERLAARVCWTHLDRASNQPSWQTRYRYDAAGRLLETIDSDVGRVEYAYDADGRMVQQTDPDGSERYYRHDDADNLWYTPRHHHIELLPGNLLSFSYIERFEYDARARLARRHQPDGSVTSYVYDSSNQLIEVRWSNRVHVWRAAYDGLGRRLWREYGGEHTDFYWDGDRLAAEVAPDGKLRIYIYSNEDALVPFLWLDYASCDARPESGMPHYLFCTPNGMPLRVEDADGQVVWSVATIDAYGEVIVTPSSTVALRLRFAGHFEDDFTGLFYNRFRDYDPGLGRYLQPDPLAQSGGINLYAYPANPLVSVDLRGLHAAKPKAEPKKQQNGAMRPTGTAADPEVKRRGEGELEPRKDLYRHEEGHEKGLIVDIFDGIEMDVDELLEHVRVVAEKMRKTRRVRREAKKIEATERDKDLPSKPREAERVKATEHDEKLPRKDSDSRGVGKEVDIPTGNSHLGMAEGIQRTGPLERGKTRDINALTPAGDAVVATVRQQQMPFAAKPLRQSTQIILEPRVPWEPGKTKFLDGKYHQIVARLGPNIPEAAKGPLVAQALESFAATGVAPDNFTATQMHALRVTLFAAEGSRSRAAPVWGQMSLDLMNAGVTPSAVLGSSSLGGLHPLSPMGVSRDRIALENRMARKAGQSLPEPTEADKDAEERQMNREIEMIKAWLKNLKGLKFDEQALLKQKQQQIKDEIERRMLNSLK
jgi:RHS repeat-associated protein